MTLTEAQENFFGTFCDCVDACQVRQDLAGAILVLGTVNVMPDDHWTTDLSKRGPVNYGQTLQASYEILTLKGKPTRKRFHISIYRMDSGNYELTTYVL